MDLGLTLKAKAEYLRTLPSIRERCGRVHDLASKDKLEYFTYHPEKEKDVVEFCISIMRVCRPLGQLALVQLPL